MKIQAVLIDGFKNLSDVKITFEIITALVALNNLGKSNVLSGIDFGLTFIKAPIDDKLEMMAFMDFIYVLFVKDKNLTIPVNFSMMSDGAKRVFILKK